MLNKRLREALERNAGYASSGNGYSPGTHRGTQESVRLWFLYTPLGPVLAGRTGDSGTTGGLCLLTFHPRSAPGNRFLVRISDEAQAAIRAACFLQWRAGERRPCI